jgi:dimethylamine monooxygenase subunit A
LRPVSEDDWLVVGGDTDAQLVEKRHLLNAALGTCVAAVPDAHGACTEAAELIARWLAERHIGRQWRRDREGIDALVAVSRVVSEDLVVMLPGPLDAGGFVLGAASLCFPTRWLLADKIGRPLGVVHEPVPDLDPQIGHATARVFETLVPSRIVLRTNWSLLDRGELHQPSATHAMEPKNLEVIDGESSPETRLWVRTERQTLRRLPQTGAVLFTIRVFQCRLDELQRELHRPLLEALDGLSPGARDYKSLAPIEQAARSWLVRDRQDH